MAKKNNIEANDAPKPKYIFWLNRKFLEKLLETKGDTLEFQGAFDKVTRRKNNATGGLAAMLGE